MQEYPIDDSSRETLSSRLRIAVLIPCYNEAMTIATVIVDFRTALPHAAIYVYDNNSSDDTIMTAQAAGAIVRSETMQGKGNVVRRMFADIEADAYVLVDGDDTYTASTAPAMVDLLFSDNLDVVNGVRETVIERAYRRGHRFGNVMLTGIVGQLFGRGISDMLTGYRVFSRRFVKSFPILSAGFEIETELTIHALELKLASGEIVTPYKERPEGSVSKLHTYSDGLRILRTIVVLVKEERPLQFFLSVAAATFLLGIALGTPVVLEYLQTKLVLRLPTAILATGLVLISALALTCGLILDSVKRARWETKQLAYLRLRSIDSEKL